MFVEKQNLVVFGQEESFFYERRKGEQILDRAFFEGPIPRLDIWQITPELWYWLLKNRLFDLKPGFTPSYESIKILDIDITEFEQDDIAIANSTMNEVDFITTMIDVLEEQLCDKEDMFVRTDFIQLSSLETLCHRHHINLYDFFIAIETGSNLHLDGKNFIPIYTNARLYYQAVDILANVKDLRYTDLAKRTGISYRNIRSDRNDSYYGRRKTITAKMLFTLSQGLGTSINTILAMCYLINNHDLFNKLKTTLYPHGWLGNKNLLMEDLK